MPYDPGTKTRFFQLVLGKAYTSRVNVIFLVFLFSFGKLDESVGENYPRHGSRSESSLIKVLAKVTGGLHLSLFVWRAHFVSTQAATSELLIANSINSALLLI